MQKGKNAIIGMVGVFVIVFVLWTIFFTGDSDQSDSSQTTNSASSPEVKYESERLKALAAVQAYKINHVLQKDTPHEINEGASLNDVFTQLKAAHIIREDSRWMSLKDGSRYVVMYHGNFSGVEGGRGSNNPQWAVMPQKDLENFTDAKIYALNGTAKTYTPELGEVEIKNNGTSKALTFYLRWESLMEKDNWNETKNQSNLDMVAKEFKVSSEEADGLFSQGQKERDGQGRSQMDERGGVLSDERIIQLLQEQGDF